MGEIDPLLGFDPAAYIASYNDLINTFGYDLEAGQKHYRELGINESRTITFQADNYLASHIDLIEAFHYDLEKAAEHYIRFGANENRAIDQFDAVTYLGTGSVQWDRQIDGCV